MIGGYLAWCMANVTWDSVRLPDMTWLLDMGCGYLPWGVATWYLASWWYVAPWCGAWASGTAFVAT